MLGFAFQRGLLPVSGAALYRALELYGRNVEENKLAFDWGRFAAESLGAGRAARERERRADEPVDVAARGDRAARGIPRRLPGPRLRGPLSRARAIASRRRSSACGPAARALQDAVARNYFSVLAYKDEYEVARLHTETRLRRERAAQLRRRRAPDVPLLSAAVRAARIPRRDGRRSTSSGRGCCRCCACSRSSSWLRGTKLDPFGYGADRRLERELLARYERVLDRIVARARRLALRARARASRAARATCAATARSRAAAAARAREREQRLVETVGRAGRARRGERARASARLTR